MRKYFNFEESLSRLEEIVDLLDKGNISLEESIKIYQEGIKLKKLCESKLNSTILRAEKINKNGEISKIDLE